MEDYSYFSKLTSGLLDEVNKIANENHFKSEDSGPRSSTQEQMEETFVYPPPLINSPCQEVFQPRKTQNPVPAEVRGCKFAKLSASQTNIHQGEIINPISANSQNFINTQDEQDNERDIVDIENETYAGLRRAVDSTVTPNSSSNGRITGPVGLNPPYAQCTPGWITAIPRNTFVPSGLPQFLNRPSLTQHTVQHTSGWTTAVPRNTFVSSGLPQSLAGPSLTQHTAQHTLGWTTYTPGWTTTMPRNTIIYGRPHLPISRTSLAQHTTQLPARRHRPKPFQCHYCPYTSRQVQYLRSHLVHHEKTSHYKCSFCNYSNESLARTLNHQGTHRNDPSLQPGYNFAIADL